MRAMARVSERARGVRKIGISCTGGASILRMRGIAWNAMTRNNKKSMPPAPHLSLSLWGARRLFLFLSVCIYSGRWECVCANAWRRIHAPPAAFAFQISPLYQISVFVRANWAVWVARNDCLLGAQSSRFCWWALDKTATKKGLRRAIKV